MMWAFCRYEGCRRKLAPEMEEAGFCDADCRKLHDEEKEFNLRMAREHIRREAEADHGRTA